MSRIFNVNTYIIMHIILLLLFFGNLSANPCNTALSAIRNEVQQSVANIQPQSQSGATSVSQPRNQPATVIQSCQAASHDQSVSHESASHESVSQSQLISQGRSATINQPRSINQPRISHDQSISHTIIRPRSFSRSQSATSHHQPRHIRNSQPRISQSQSISHESLTNDHTHTRTHTYHDCAHRRRTVSPAMNRADEGSNLRNSHTTVSQVCLGWLGSPRLMPPMRHRLHVSTDF